MFFWGDFFLRIGIPWDEHHHQITINLGEYVLPHDGSMGRTVYLSIHEWWIFYGIKCRQIDRSSHGSVMATFCRHRFAMQILGPTRLFRYLKWRNPHLYKLYGSGLCKGKPIPQIAPNKVFSETLHFGYLRLFGEGYLHLALQEVHLMFTWMIHPSSSLCGVDFCWAP